MEGKEDKHDGDSRVECKYGSVCYQKNKAHHEKYKHPSDKVVQDPKKTTQNNRNESSRTLKQQKLTFSQPTKGQKTQKNDSENENENAAAPKIKISNEECKKIIKSLFLVDMPDDFYSFWDFCKDLCPSNPTDALSEVGLKLVGPFDVLSGILKEGIMGSNEVLRHWRYYYDPPEFQTVIKSDRSDLFHLGYFRDDPKEPPVFVAYNEAAKNCLITSVAENLFGAINTEKTMNPFKRMKTSNFKSSLHDWAKNNNFTLEKYTKNMQKRNKAAVCKTFHQAGIVVPYEKKTELGYRPLSETPNNLKKLLQQIETAKTPEQRTSYFNQLYSIINWANIAMDEGDFGTNLELGLDLFSYGTDHFNTVLITALENAYSLLHRKPFIQILKAHLEDRKKGDDLSVLKTKERM